MLMLRALSDRSITRIWAGQALSAVGDEIYRVAFVWMAVSLIGADTGYLGAASAIAVLLTSLALGSEVDRWDQRRTLILVDLGRAAVVLIPVVAAVAFGYQSLGLLAAVAVLLSVLSGFFEPAIQGTLPAYCEDRDTLQAAVGLMSTTFRGARVAGPVVISLLTPALPMIHFFTLDAVTFAVSALSIASLGTPLKSRGAPPARLNMRESVLAGFRLIEGDAQFRYFIWMKAALGAAWQLAFGLGLALQVQRIAPGDVRAFGLAIAAYGVGNLGSALVLGNVRRHRPIRLMSLGYICLGGGFVLGALAPSLPWLMVAMFTSALGGPYNDVPFTDIVQSRFALADLPKIIRLRMVLETAFVLITMLLAPTLFRWLTVPGVLALAGGAIVAGGAVCLREHGEA